MPWAADIQAGAAGCLVGPAPGRGVLGGLDVDAQARADLAGQGLELVGRKDLAECRRGEKTFPYLFEIEPGERDGASSGMRSPYPNSNVFSIDDGGVIRPCAAGGSARSAGDLFA